MKTIPLDQFVPYVEGTPGTRMTFPCGLQVLHPGACVPGSAKRPDEVLTRCPAILMIKDDELNEYLVGRLLEKMTPASIESVHFGTPSGDSIGEGLTVKCDTILDFKVREPPGGARARKFSIGDPMAEDSVVGPAGPARSTCHEMPDVCAHGVPIDPDYVGPTGKEILEQVEDREARRLAEEGA